MIFSQGASLLFDTLQNLDAEVCAISLGHCHLNDQFMNALKNYVQYNEHLVSLNLDGNQITDEGISILSEALVGHASLQQLYLRSNALLTDASFPYLRDIVKSTHVDMLDLSYTEISGYFRKEIHALLDTPIDQREASIQSATKSASKISFA